jgi:hypothetical protein
VFPKLTQVHVAINYSPFNGPFIPDLEDSLAGAAKQLTKANIRLCLDILPPPPPHTLDLWRTTQSPIYATAEHLVVGPVLCHVRQVTFGADVLVAINRATSRHWFPMFPLLEHVEFLNAHVWFDHQIKMSWVRFIVQTCPSVRSVRIGDDTRDVSAWLSSDI